MGRGSRLATKYELQRLLGRGSLAEVWKAFDTKLKRSVALKLLHPDLQVDLDFITRFERELPVISSLRHPNIVQILDYQISRPRGTDHLKAYIVMNYVKGQTLADYILNTSRAGQFPSTVDMVHLFRAVGGAIDYAHQHGVIHADIKPSNILLDKQYLLRNPMGEPKLVDFGIAKMLAADTGKFNSQLSTSAYISPEQANFYLAADELSDIYSLGVILYELCTGKLPFEGENINNSLIQGINSIPAPPNSINPGISRAVSDVVLRSLAKDPAERFSSASAMTEALALALDEPVSKNLDWFISLPDNHSPSTQLHASFQSEGVELDKSPSLLESRDEPTAQRAAWSPSSTWWSPRVSTPATTSPLETDHLQPPQSRRPGKSIKPAVEEPAPVLEVESLPTVQSETSDQPAVEEPPAVESVAPQQPVVEEPLVEESVAPQQPVVEEPLVEESVASQQPALEEPPAVESVTSQQPALEEPAPDSWKPGSFWSIDGKQATEKPISLFQKHQPGSTRAIAPKVHDVPVVVDLKRENKQKRQGKQKKARKLYFVACVLLLVLLCTSVSVFSLVEYQTYNAKYHADMSLAQEGIQHFQRGIALFETLPQNPLNAPTLQKARLEFTESLTIFSQLNNELRLLPGLSQSLPIYGARLHAALHLLPIAIEVSQAGVIACNTLDLLSSRFHSGLNTRSQGLMKADLSVISQNFQSIKTILSLVIGQVNSLQTGDLQFDPRLNKLVTKFQKDIPALQSQLDVAGKIISLAPEVLGIGVPTNYLIEMLDSTQLSPGGGFIDSYGIATLSGGQLATAHITDVDLLDDPFQAAGGQIPLPAAYTWFNQAPTWSFRDSNLDADFPTVARYAELTYRQEGGKVPVQGVIAITPAFIEHALAITGPITVPEYQETITAQNLVDRIHYYQSGPGKQENNSSPKRFTEALTAHFLLRLRQLSPSLSLKLWQQIISSLHSKDIQIYLNSSTAEHLLQSYHLDAAIQSPSSDSLFVVDANIGADQVNSLITNTLNDQVTIDGQGNAIHHTTLRYAWVMQGQDYSSSLYRDYLRVYAPPGSKLLVQDGWESRGTSEAFNNKVWAGFFTLSFGQTRTITLVWKVPGAVKKGTGGWDYQYTIQRQAGAQWTLNLQVTLPPCARRIMKLGGLVSSSPKAMALTQPLNADMNVGVNYTC